MKGPEPRISRRGSYLSSASRGNTEMPAPRPVRLNSNAAWGKADLITKVRASMAVIDMIGAALLKLFERLLRLEARASQRFQVYSRSIASMGRPLVGARGSSLASERTLRVSCSLSGENSQDSAIS